jgi:two-component system KDP operon response regulator KdpE
MFAPADPIALTSTTTQAATAKRPLVLVVDDEVPIQTTLRLVLSAHGLRTSEALTGAAALERAAAEKPDLVLLDLGLPDSDGRDVIRRLRDWMAVPILVISARGEEQDKIALLDAGANDYLTKPLATDELLARIRVWIRHSSRAEPDGADLVLEVGDLRVDLTRRLVSVAGRELHLTPIEYNLFVTLMRNRGRVMTHRQLLETTWGPRYKNQTQYLRVYMGQLRRKLEHEAARPRYLLTEPGVGYRIR